MIKLRFTPAEDSSNEPLELGPFREVSVADGSLIVDDGVILAYVYAETADDMHQPENMFGHPDAGKWVISETERLYGRCEFLTA